MANWLIIGLWLTISESARRPQQTFTLGTAPGDPATEVIDVRERDR